MGLTILDAGVIIAVLDSADFHHESAAQALTAARARGDTLALPASAYAECLVAPYRRGAEAAAIVDEFVDALPARVEPASRAIGNAAAALRADHAGSLRLPDALVIATAIVLRADRILTTDSRWPTVGVAVVVVSGST